MKEHIHPKYYEKSKITCVSCNTIYEVGSTAPSMNIEICGSCHPFYTGKYRVIDSTGRVERFNKKYAKFFSGEPDIKVTSKPEDSTENKEQK